MIEDGIKSYLGGIAGLTALVGTRLYPLRKPQAAAYPQVTYFVVSRPYRHTTTARALLVTGRFQFDGWALSYAAAKAIAAQLVTALDGVRGTWGTTKVQFSRIDDERDGPYEPPEQADDVGIYRISLDALITYQE